jgi:hypothetical protein
MCDLLVALGEATANGSTIFAKNSDRPPTETQLIEVVESRTESTTRATYLEIPGSSDPTLRCVVSRPAWSWGAEHGVNEAGVAIGNATIYTTLDPRPFPDALTGMDLVRLGLERARDARSAVEVIIESIERFGQGGSGHDPTGSRRPYWNSFLVADHRSAWVLETSGREWAMEEVRTVRAISNRTTIPGFDDRRHPRQPVETLVDPRWRSTNEFLARGPVTVDGVGRHLTTHGPSDDGWNVCMHVDGVEETTASMIAVLPTSGVPEVRMTQASPCREPWSVVRW